MEEKDERWREGHRPSANNRGFFSSAQLTSMNLCNCTNCSRHRRRRRGKQGGGQAAAAFSAASSCCLASSPSSSTCGGAGAGGVEGVAEAGVSSSSSGSRPRCSRAGGERRRALVLRGGQSGSVPGEARVRVRLQVNGARAATPSLLKDDNLPHKI